MKRQVARVNIYINPFSTESSVTADSRNGEFDITINQGEGKHAIKNVSDFQTTLAHELGHVIALLTKDPSHDTRQNFAARDDFGGTHQLNIGAEERAWQFAHDIWPDLNQKAEDWSLGTYREHKALVESGRVPRFQQYVTLPEPEPDDFTGRWEDDGGTRQLWQDYLETRNLAPDLPRYTTPQDIAFYPEDAHSPTVLESHSPTFDKFMQDWAFQNAPVKAEPKPEPIEPMTTGQTIAAVLFLIALFSAASTIVGYALLGAIEVLR